MSKKSRNKGQRGEREIAKKLSEWWGSEFTRTPMSGGFHTKEFRDDWNAGGDIVTPDETFPFSVEIKWQENWNFEQLITAPKCKIWQWWEQATSECPEGKTPLLVFKRNHSPWFYMMYWGDNIALDSDDKFRLSVSTPEGSDNLDIGLFSDLLSGDPKEWLNDE